MLKFLTAAFCLVAVPVSAQSVLRDCSTWQSSVRNVPEPWSTYSRTFSNGAVRITLLDTIEPAAAALYLQIISPPYDELGSRSCVLLTEDGGRGFANLFFEQLQASYDPSVGLTFRIPAERYDVTSGGYDPAILAVSVNQATGAITPRFEIP